MTDTDIYIDTDADTDMIKTDTDISVSDNRYIGPSLPYAATHIHIVLGLRSNYKHG